MFRDALPAAASYLALGFAVMASSYLLSMPLHQAWPAVSSALLWIVTLLRMRSWMMHRRVPLRWMFPLGMGLVGMVAVSLSLAMGMSGNPTHTLHYGLLVVGCGLLFLSWVQMWAGVVLTLGSWKLTAWLAGVDIQGHLYPHTLAGCLVMAGLACAVRRSVVFELIAATHAQREKQFQARRLSDQLAVREREYRELFTRMLNGFAINQMVYDAQGRAVDYIITEVNDQFEAMTGLSRSRVVGRRVRQVLPTLEPFWIERFDQVVRTGEATHFQQFTAALGRWYEVMAYAMGGDRFAVVFTDVTERRRMEDARREREARYRRLAESNRRLLHEVNHRVRNNLASLRGLISMTRRQAQSVEQYHDAISLRLLAMTSVHDILAASNWGHPSMRELVGRLVATMHQSAPNLIPVRVQGPEVTIPARSVAPLIMTLAELFTNSCKHGAHLRSSGQLLIQWTMVNDGAGPRIDLVWRETGGPPILKPPVRSLGCELIEGFVGFELGGQVELAFPPDGAYHRLTFPLMDPQGGQTLARLGSTDQPSKIPA